MRDSSHDILFRPLEIRGKVFRNRFYSTPHASFVPGRRLSDIAFRRMKAEGGWAAVCGGVISMRSDAWGGLVPRIWDEDERVMLGRVASEVQGQGALAGIEFGHGGANSEGAKFSPALGVSQLSDPGRGHLVPKEMEIADIERLQQDWIEAAVMAARIGYDIVYAYGSHGTLPAQFLSPLLNRRRDRYGGEFDNRARFWLEMIEGMRTAVGDECLVVARIAAESFSPFGIPIEETLRFVEAADQWVDLWDVNVGSSWAPDSAPSRVASEGSQVEWTGRVREATSKPVVGVGRLSDPNKMAEILRSGAWDLIGGARPGIADPFLPTKIEEGRYEDIRECTGTNYCIAVETAGAGLSCVQNATIGEEYRRKWHPERFTAATGGSSVDVLVVGGGPAGMECARVLGERGVRTVHLVEARDEIGGHLAWLRRLPGLGDWGRVTDYRKIQLDKLANVEVITGRELTSHDILEYGAQTVVVATGSRWIGPADEWHLFDPGLLQHHELEVLTPESVMLDGEKPRGSVLIWDGDGGAVAAGLAERLAGGAKDVTLSAATAIISPQLDLSFEGTAVRSRLHDLGVVLRPGITPQRAVEGGVAVVDQMGAPETVGADTLLLVAQRRSDDVVFRDLSSDAERLLDAGIADLVRIGDCLAPRHLGLVIADGHRMGREIDSGNPQTPIEPLRERDVDAATADFSFPVSIAVAT